MIISAEPYNRLQRSVPASFVGGQVSCFNSSNSQSTPFFPSLASFPTYFPLSPSQQTTQKFPTAQTSLVQLVLGGVLGGTAFFFGAKTLKNKISPKNPSRSSRVGLAGKWSYTNAERTFTSKPYIPASAPPAKKQKSPVVVPTTIKDKTTSPSASEFLTGLLKSVQSTSGNIVSTFKTKRVRWTAIVLAPLAAIAVAHQKGAFEGIKFKENPSLVPLEIVEDSKKTDKVSSKASPEASSISAVNINAAGDKKVETNVLVYGNGLPGITLALEIKRLKPEVKVVLVRAEAEEELYGEIGQSLLAYWDRNKSSLGDSKMTQLILERAGVDKDSVSVNPKNLDLALRKMLKEAGVEVYHGVDKITPELKNERIESVSFEIQKKRLVVAANQVIDGSENANLAREIPEIKFEGLESIDSKLANSTLGVSPMLVLKGVTINKIVEMENSIRKKISSDPAYKDRLEAFVRKNYPQFKAEQVIDLFTDKAGKPYLTKNAMDMKSLLLPVAFHEKYNLPMELSSGRLEAGNIAQFTYEGVETISYNGLVWSLPMNEVQRLIKEGGLKGAEPTPVMVERLKQLESFFQEYIPDAKLIIPKRLYVRHSGNISQNQVVKPVTLKTLLQDQKPKELIGEFCYPLDNRGLKEEIAILVETNFCFETGIEHTLVLPVSNFALVSRSAGYSETATFTGRIISANMNVATNLAQALIKAEEERLPLNIVKTTDLLRKFGSRKSPSIP